jgi:hypothetical protein
MAIKTHDSKFMSSLLRLISRPNLSHMHGDLVDDLHLICTLLSKRPMVGSLIARRLKLPVDKTFALLSVLASSGFLMALSPNSVDLDLNDLEQEVSTNSSTTSPRISEPVIASPSASKTALLSEPNKTHVDLRTSGDVLNQLWRVLNTDIVMSKATLSKTDPKLQNNKEVGDVLNQLWQVLNADISVKSASVTTTKVKPETQGTIKTTSIKNNEQTAEINKNAKLAKDKDKDKNEASESASKGKVVVLKDVNGQPIFPDAVENKSVEKEAGEVMSQLWSVLNTDIAFKRQSGINTGAAVGKEPSAAKTKEVSEVMNQLWRVLNTEIAAKRQVNSKEETESLTDTTREANDKLSKLWQILDAEIVLKKTPKTYLMSDDPVLLAQKEVEDTSNEAVSRLSQLWKVLNAEIGLALPAEKRVKVAKKKVSAQAVS